MIHPFYRAARAVPVALAAVVLVSVCGGMDPALADGNEVPGGIAAIAVREAEKRQEQVKSAQTLFSAGARAQADQSYGEAMDYFKAAFELMPEVPAVETQRIAFFKRYQSSAYAYARQLAEEARWAQAEQTLTEVLTLAQEGGIPVAVVDPDLREMLGELKSMDGKYNMATTPRHLLDVDIVKTKLIVAKGYLELGDYDRAERTYNEVLNIDAYNSAARRGLENVERHRMNYFDVAYDHTRAKALAQVAAGWESPVPSIELGLDELAIGADVAVGNKVRLERKLNEIVIPSLEFNDARLADVLEFLVQKSQELDSFESDPLKRGVNIVVDSSGSSSGGDLSQRTLTVRLSNVPLGVALKYVSQQVGMKFRVDEFAVTVIPASVADSVVVQTRTYEVPPGFLSMDARGAGAAAPVDPFAEPQDTGGNLVERIDAQQFLEQNGIIFGTGASARFIAATSTLIVTNTTDQLITVENLIQSVREGGNKMVQVRLKMISIEDAALHQMGMDWLLGASNVGTTPRIFVSGGTDGNADVPVQPANFPFNGPNGIPVGMNPVTSGLRMQDLATTQSIEDIINRDNPEAAGTRAPAVFAVSGVFTDPMYQAVLRAVSQHKGTDFLCDTHVLTRPGQIARIEQVREFIYPTEYDPPEIPNDFGGVQIGNTRFVGAETGVFPATPATPTAFETRALGKILEVEPTVGDDNRTVNLNITTDFTDFVGFINYGTPIRNPNFLLQDGSPSVVTENPILMPVFDAILETTNVTVWDGQTIAIGGYHGETVTDAEDKVPFLGDLPVLGSAFRSSIRDSTKRALLIFVSVRLIDPGGNPINRDLREQELVSQ